MNGVAVTGLAILAQGPSGCGGLEHALTSCHGDALPVALVAAAAAAVAAVVGGVIAALIFPELMNALSGVNQALAGSAAAGAAGAAAAAGPPTAGGGPLTLDELMNRYDQLGDTPPEINLVDNDAAYAWLGAHSIERHGPHIPLERDPSRRTRTIRGRIYGDPPWPHAANWSHRWTDWTTMHRTINGYLHDDWEAIRTDLAFNGVHRSVFEAGHRVGEGYFNSGMYRTGPRPEGVVGAERDPPAVYHATSLVRIVIRLVPGSDPPRLYVQSAFPTAGVG